jgi:hypothetical protein
VGAKDREGQSVIKRERQKFDMEIFYLKKANDTEGKEQYEVKIQIGLQLWKTCMMMMMMMMWTSEGI